MAGKTSWMEWKGWLLIAVSCLGGTWGCGSRVYPQKEAPGEVAQASTPGQKELERAAAAQMELSVLAGSNEDDLVPESESRASDLLVEDSRIHFQDVVGWPKEKSPKTGKIKSLYLVWTQRSLPGPMDEGLFRCDRISALNEKVSGTQLHQVEYDPARERWFVPILKCLDGQASNAHAADTQIIHLDLHFKDGSRLLLDVDLRIQGPLPYFPLSRQTSIERKVAFANVRDFMERARNGFRVHQDSVENRSDHDYALWVRTDAKPTFNLKSRITRLRWDDRNSSRLDYYHSNAGMSVRFLEVTYSKAAIAPERTQVTDGEWIRLALPAKSSVRLDWIGMFHAGFTQCQLDPQVEKDFAWTEPKEVCERKFGGRGGEGGTDVCHTVQDPRRTSRSEYSSVLNLDFGGSVNRWIRIADPNLSQKEALDEAQARGGWLAQGEPERFLEYIGEGERQDGVPYPCQGIF